VGLSSTCSFKACCMSRMGVCFPYDTFAYNKIWGKFSEPKQVHQYTGSQARADVHNAQIFYSFVYEFRA